MSQSSNSAASFNGARQLSLRGLNLVVPTHFSPFVTPQVDLQTHLRPYYKGDHPFNYLGMSNQHSYSVATAPGGLQQSQDCGVAK